MAFDRQLEALSSEALSAFAQDCFIAGYQIGFREGFKESFQEGFQEGFILETIKFLKSEFGELSPTIIKKLKKLSIEKRGELIEVLFDFESKESLVKWLSTNN